MFSRLSRLLPWSFPVVLIAAYAWTATAATTPVADTTVGAVETIQGHGWGVTDEGGQYDKLGGDLVAMDEVVATGVNSAMTMRFMDDTTMTLGPSDEITVDEMVYNPEDCKNDTVLIRLGVGSFYFVSGKVAKEKVTIMTPTASIGIRGTELVISVKEDGTTSVGVAKGHAFMRSREGSGRTVEVNVGSTAKTSVNGTVSEPFQGLDLAGEEDVDRNIPGVSDWMDEGPEKDDEKDLTEFSNDAEKGDREIGGGDEGEKDQKFSDNEDEPSDDTAKSGDETDTDEVDSKRGDGEGDNGDGGEGEGGDGGEGEGGDGGEGEGGDGGEGEGGDGGEGEGGDGDGEGGDGGGGGGDGGGDAGDGGEGEGGDGGAGA